VGDGQGFDAQVASPYQEMQKDRRETEGQDGQIQIYLPILLWQISYSLSEFFQGRGLVKVSLL
jgi:hypothetical protein